MLKAKIRCRHRRAVLQYMECAVVVLDWVSRPGLQIPQEGHGLVNRFQRYVSVGVYLA